MKPLRTILISWNVLILIWLISTISVVSHSALADLKQIMSHLEDNWGCEAIQDRIQCLPKSQKEKQQSVLIISELATNDANELQKLYTTLISQNEVIWKTDDDLNSEDGIGLLVKEKSLKNYFSYFHFVFKLEKPTLIQYSFSNLIDGNGTIQKIQKSIPKKSLNPIYGTLQASRANKLLIPIGILTFLLAIVSIWIFKARQKKKKIRRDKAKG